jgi:ABC-type cobalamin/Fe3+-siderophores transport system ATPase subunit
MDRVLLMKQGRLVYDGGREAALTPVSLRNLFGVEVEIATRDGFIHSW